MDGLRFDLVGFLMEHPLASRSLWPIFECFCFSNALSLDYFFLWLFCECLCTAQLLWYFQRALSWLWLSLRWSTLIGDVWFLQNGSEWFCLFCIWFSVVRSCALWFSLFCRFFWKLISITGTITSGLGKLSKLDRVCIHIAQINSWLLAIAILELLDSICIWKRSLLDRILNRIEVVLFIFKCLGVFLFFLLVMGRLKFNYLLLRWATTCL